MKQVGPPGIDRSPTVKTNNREEKKKKNQRWRLRRVAVVCYVCYRYGGHPNTLPRRLVAVMALRYETTQTLDKQRRRQQRGRISAHAYKAGERNDKKKNASTTQPRRDAKNGNKMRKQRRLVETFG